MATDELSRTFSALADPTRRAILGMLSRGDATVNEIAAPFAMSLPAVSKHLQVLEKAGLISRGRDAQWRPARLNAITLAPAADWIDGYRRFWEHSFDALEEHLATNQHHNDNNNDDNDNSNSNSNNKNKNKNKNNSNTKGTTND